MADTCDVCGTELHQNNTTGGGQHMPGNCAQVLVSQRDKARAERDENWGLLSDGQRAHLTSIRAVEAREREAASLLRAYAAGIYRGDEQVRARQWLTTHDAAHPAPVCKTCNGTKKTCADNCDGQPHKVIDCPDCTAKEGG